MEEYFTRLAAKYPHWTGHSTEKIITISLETATSPIINVDSIINDNASGPCTASTAIIAHLGKEPAQIHATDYNAGMVEAAKQQIKSKGWKNVQASLMDSHELKIPDDTFTVTISNVNISTHRDPFQCLREMHRTLQPKGTLIVTIWKRFGVQEVMDAARKIVRPDGAPVAAPRAEFFQDGYLRDMISRAEFQGAEQSIVSVLSTGADLDGLRDFMLSDLVPNTRREWSDAENAQWPSAIDQAIKDEVATYGGVRSDVWVVTATK